MTMKIKFILILMGAAISLSACRLGNHTDPHLYFLQDQQKAIGNNIIQYKGKNNFERYHSKEMLLNGNLIYKFDYRKCLQIIEVDKNNIIVRVDVEGVKTDCRLNQN